MIKLIATDMDGTLLDENGRLNEETFEVIKKLKEKNILFAAASGRQYYTLHSNFSNVKDDIIYAAENGSFLVYKGEELYSSTLDSNAVKDMLKAGRKLEGCEIVLCGKKAAYIEKGRKDLIEEVRKYYFRHEIIDNLSEVEDDFLKFTLCDFKGSAENSNKVFAPAFGDKFQVTVSGQIWLDVNNKNTNKGTALRLLQEKFGITPEETMVFGDYYNDIDMLQAAYHSYAVANAPEDVRKHARFIAGSNSENGVLEVIKREVLQQTGVLF